MLITVKRDPVRLLTAALLVAAVFAALVASDAQAAVRHFDGKVLSKNNAAHTFRIRTENGNRIRFRVNGCSGLERGLRVEVDAKRTNQGLLAMLVEKRRRGGGEDGGPGHG